MAQWDGTSPLRPEHEVAYRGWPKVKVEHTHDGPPSQPIRTARKGREWHHSPDGTHCNVICPFDLIPLQKEPGNE